MLKGCHAWDYCRDADPLGRLDVCLLVDKATGVYSVNGGGGGGANSAAAASPPPTCVFLQSICRG